MDRPVTIGNVHNMSLENFSEERPHLVTQFSCETEVCDCIPPWRASLFDFGWCCAAVWLHDMYNVTVKGIIVTSNVSGIILTNVSNVIIQLTTTYPSVYPQTSCRVSIFHSVPYFSTKNCTCGLVVYNATNSHISDITATHNDFGVLLVMTSDSAITNTVVTNNTREGLKLIKASNTQITNTTAAYNDGHGMGLSTVYNTHITNTTATYNCYVGVFLSTVHDTHITNTTAAYNDLGGMTLFTVYDTHITSTTAAYNGEEGMFLFDVYDTHITNTTATYNGEEGMLLFYVYVAHITNTTATYNGEGGMHLFYVHDAHITNTTATYNDGGGMHLSTVHDTHITNTTATYNGYSGMFSYAVHDTHIINTTAAYNGYSGMTLSTVHDTHITNTTATYNDLNGMFLNRVHDTHITNTTAAYNSGEGMFLFYVNDSHITNTTATYNGGGGMFLFYVHDAHITNITATHNVANGMALINVSSTHIGNAKATHNDGPGMLLREVKSTNITKLIVTLNVGFGVHEQVSIFSSTNTLIYNSSFTDIHTSGTDTTRDPSGLPVVIGLHESSVNISGCNFTGNHISSIRGDTSNITLSGELTFSSNKAIIGTAFILVQGSTLSLAENSYTYFLNNHATNTGGVFHIVTDIHWENLRNSPELVMFPMTKCFVSTKCNRSPKKFAFVNNSAGMGGDILYGGQVALGLDGDWNFPDNNCLDSFKNISNISQNGLSLISSDPSRVCLCSGTGQPDCLTLADPTPHSIYPGQSVSISAVVVGQDFGTVAGFVYAQFLQTSPTGSPTQSESWQWVDPVTQRKCNHLSYTIPLQSEVFEAVLVFTAQNYSHSSPSNCTYSVNPQMWELQYNTSNVDPLIYSNNPVCVSISFLPCPPGFMLTTDPPFRCVCDHLLQQMDGIQCHIQDQTIGRSGLLWVGMIQDENGTNGTVAASKYCPLDYCYKGESNVTLQESDSQCNYNHAGILCGGCQPGLSLALGSAQCLPCNNKYLALLIPFTLAGPVLVGIIKLLDLTISQGTLNGLIFYANIVKATDYIFLPQGQTNPLTLFIAWLNLDLGVETCFFNGLSAYSKTWLQFVFPLYIWSIAGLIIILAKYSDRVAKVMGNNSVPVLATLFLLSYAKIFNSIITALSYTMVYTSHGPKAVWTADGNVDYLGPKHAPLFAVALSSLLFLWLPYTLLLFLGQWLHMCNCRPISHLLMKIKPFLDAHYGPLKGKHRYWFGALLLVRAVILLIQALVPTDYASTVVLCISVCAIVLTHYGHFVYRNLAVSAFDAAFFMNLALLTGTNLFANTAGQDPTVAAYILTGMAFTQFIGLIFFKLFSILKRNRKTMACLRKEQPVEDDWEAYEEAAVLREMEAASEEEDKADRESYESNASLPTY